MRLVQILGPVDQEDCAVVPDDVVSLVLSALPMVAHTFSMNLDWLIGNCLKPDTSCLKPKTNIYEPSYSCGRSDIGSIPVIRSLNFAGSTLDRNEPKLNWLFAQRL